VDERARARYVLIPWMIGSFVLLLVGSALHSFQVVGVALTSTALWIMVGGWYGAPRTQPGGRRTAFWIGLLPAPIWRATMIAIGLFLLVVAVTGLVKGPR
jgi:hypothetical protein